MAYKSSFCKSKIKLGELDKWHNYGRKPLPFKCMQGTLTALSLKVIKKFIRAP
jgi:hypothetical protein